MACYTVTGHFFWGGASFCMGAPSPPSRQSPQKIEILSVDFDFPGKNSNLFDPPFFVHSLKKSAIVFLTKLTKPICGQTTEWIDGLMNVSHRHLFFIAMILVRPVVPSETPKPAWRRFVVRQQMQRRLPSRSLLRWSYRVGRHLAKS